MLIHPGPGAGRIGQVLHLHPPVVGSQDVPVLLRAAGCERPRQESRDQTLGELAEWVPVGDGESQGTEGFKPSLTIGLEGSQEPRRLVGQGEVVNTAPIDGQDADQSLSSGLSRDPRRAGLAVPFCDHLIPRTRAVYFRRK